jgi:alpha-L-glutamate ligase-like protein
VRFNAVGWLRDAGVLGMNRRNAEYVMPHNPRSAFPLVDDKLLTKRLAAEYVVPTPELFHVISHHGDIAGFEKAIGDRKEFVVKPARGSGGSGIMLVTDRVNQGFVKHSGEKVSREEFAYNISDILSGIYSLEGREDRAIIEALVHPDPVFASVTHLGVPDIRIVAYRGVPVMAMTRLPTRKSDGKANLHRGAIGVGIDIGNGITMAAVHGSRIVTRHPDTGNGVDGIAVPFWERMLVIAAQAVDMTGLGYLGVDLIIDRDKGPLLLELNARPGLQIQVANQSGLQKRLEMVDRAPGDVFRSPESRVMWARTMFTADKL